MDPAVIPLARYSVSYDGRREVFLVRSLEEIPLCPSCGRRLRTFGYRLRHVIADDGLARWYELQRLRCDDCRLVHVWMPGFIRAHKYYDSQTIQDAIAGISDYCPAEDTTIWRWKKSAKKDDT